MAIPNSDVTNSASLSALFDNAANQLLNSQEKKSHDGFLYSGNRHETVPRALLLDKRLTPLERNAWQVFRLLLNQDGITAFPTYDQLAPFLASMPCKSKASHETVARALTILRLSRWLSLVRRQRDPRTGRIRGNLYVLHDEPLTPFEAIQLDPEYLELVSHSLEHSSKAIQKVGSQVLQDFSEDPLLRGRILPTRLQVLTRRMTEKPLETPESYPQDQGIHDSEEGDHKSEEGMAALLRNRDWLPSDSEVGGKTSKLDSLRNPKSDRTSTNNIYNNNYSVRTVPRAREDLNLRWPDRFETLKNEQRAGALVALRQVDTHLQQSVLDEWAVRCSDGNIHNPAGYLFGIIQKAIRGEFKPWAWPGEFTSSFSNNIPATAVSFSSLDSSGSAEIADTHLQQLRSLFDEK